MGQNLAFLVYPLNWEESEVVYKGFREEGYLPEALKNYLAFLGWSNDKEKEVYKMEDLINDFDINNINKSGAKFDPEKLLWLNSQHIQLMSDEDLSKIISDQTDVDPKKSIFITKMIKPRLEKLSGLIDKFNYLINKPNFDTKTLQKFQNSEVKENLNIAADFFSGHSVIDASNLKESMFNFLKEKNIKPGKIMPAIRVALVGKLEGPDLFELAYFFGSKEVVKRLNNLSRAI